MTTTTTTRRSTTRSTTYGQLQNGDRVWIEGYLFEVCNLRIVSAYMTISEGYGPGRPVVRFEGRVVDPTASIARTGYDGGTYGGILNRDATVAL